MSAKFSAKGGVGLIEHLSMYTTFLGSTGEGEFPPTDMSYEQITIKPKAGVDGILVFQHDPRMISGIGFDFYQYHWVKGKIVFEYDVHSERSFSVSKNSGFMVQYRNWIYVTQEPKNADQNCKVVDLFQMLRYLEGKIEIADLERNARSFERRQGHEKRLIELRREVEALKAENARHELLQRTVHQSAMHFQVELNLVLDAIERMAPAANWLERWWYRPMVADDFLINMRLMETVRKRNGRPIPMKI
jgi:hypothetical protein